MTDPTDSDYVACDYVPCTECDGRGVVFFQRSETRADPVECPMCLGSGEELAGD
jgi:DnaJ-class molecular chaperone